MKKEELIENNKKWAAAIKDEDPTFFERLSQQQSPKYLWIGCADSRVPANDIVGLMPGELFVHRNVANVVAHTDFNCLSVVQYAVEVLKVEHIIICGHYGCGGVAAALGDAQHGLIDNWLREIKDVYHKYHQAIDSQPTTESKVDRLCEFNVLEQVANVGSTTIVQNAWLKGQNLTISGWIYSIKDGLIKDLNFTLTSIEHIPKTYRLTS